MTTAAKVRWEEMFPDELLSAIERCPVCYMAYGLAEPHGAYAALGLDWIKAQGLCERAALAHGGVVAPPFCWHVQERPQFDWCRHHGVKEPLYSSLPADLFLKIVLHQLRVFDARGFHVAILITGHYGGLERDMRLLCEFYQRRSGSAMQIYCIADSECIEYENYHGDHAGLCETQQLQAIRPDLVDLSRKEPSPHSGPWCGADFAKSGSQPAAQVGAAIVQSQIASLGRKQQELLARHRAAPGGPGTGPGAGCPGGTVPNQDQVDEMWHSFERLTRKYWVLSATLQEFRNPPPAFPGWEALGC